jgi:hypothetical protein
MASQLLIQPLPPHQMLLQMHKVQPMLPHQLTLLRQKLLLTRHLQQLQGTRQPHLHTPQMLSHWQASLHLQLQLHQMLIQLPHQKQLLLLIKLHLLQVLLHKLNWQMLLQMLPLIQMLQMLQLLMLILQQSMHQAPHLLHNHHQTLLHQKLQMPLQLRQTLRHWQVIVLTLQTLMYNHTLLLLQMLLQKLLLVQKLLQVLLQLLQTWQTRLQVLVQMLLHWHPLLQVLPMLPIWLN